MANLLTKVNTAKKFIPAQVEVHNRAVDVLSMMQKCINKMGELKKQIANIDADFDYLPAFAIDGQQETKAQVVDLYNFQVVVYRRITAYYLKQLSALYDPAIYHHVDFYQQPDKPKTVHIASWVQKSA